jgi:ribonuclease-3
VQKECSLEKRINYQFNDKKLLDEALTHKSCKKPYNNERLEFLGDAVLDLVVGEYLFKKFPDFHEGNLSKLRASIVNEKGFQKFAKELNLGECIYISVAEENNDGRQKASICSNAFEALMGAVYLDGGLDKVEAITVDLLEKVYPNIDLETIFKDYKTTLQEITQAKMGVTPEYVLVKATGPDHKKEFEIMVKVAGKEFAKANGKSKKEAQQEAAKKAIQMIEEEKNGGK